MTAESTIDFWAGEFGDEYLRRQRINWQDRVPFWRMLMERTGAMSFLEIGCNEAHNLEAIRSINPGAVMSGVDVNEAALAKAGAKGFDVLNAPGWEVATLFGAGACELAFTSGVLIHVAPEDLRRTMEAIRDVSSQYVLAVEYAAERETEVEYRGYAGRLWKRDYGRLYEQLGLGLVETGRAEGWPEIDVTYWLMEKAR